MSEACCPWSELLLLTIGVHLAICHEQENGFSKYATTHQKGLALQRNLLKPWLTLIGPEASELQTDGTSIKILTSPQGCPAPDDQLKRLDPSGVCHARDLARGQDTNKRTYGL